jgi:HK97 family phage portal protein
VAGNSLFVAIANGLRKPLAVKASIQSWLGVPISLQDHGFWREYAGTSSWTGKQVTVDQALQLATVWACVRLISETIATLPLQFFTRNADGSRTPATSHQLYGILHNQPNADMTAVVFWEIVEASLLLWGNAYIEVLRSGDRVVALDFLHPARMTLRRLAGGEFEYRYRNDSRSAERVIPERNMMHIPAFSVDGKLGLSPITYGANVMGTAIETDKASAETFESAMRSPGILTMDMVMSPDQRDKLRAHVNKVSTEGGVMVVEKGTGFEPLTFNPHDAELLASRAWNVEEMCRWFRTDPAMIGHGSKDSNWGTGLEQKMLWFLTFTLRHWCVRIEQAVWKSLLTPAERSAGYFASFNMEGLLRADSASRAAFYATMTSNGLMTRDECRGKENLPPKGGNADVLTVQSAMVAIDDMSTGTNSAERGILAAAKSWLGIEQPASVED